MPILRVRFFVLPLQLISETTCTLRGTADVKQLLQLGALVLGEGQALQHLRQLQRLELFYCWSSPRGHEPSGGIPARRSSAPISRADPPPKHRSHGPYASNCAQRCRR